MCKLKTHIFITPYEIDIIAILVSDGLPSIVGFVNGGVATECHRDIEKIRGKIVGGDGESLRLSSVENIQTIGIGTAAAAIQHWVHLQMGFKEYRCISNGVEARVNAMAFNI